ncbi:uncharacterized protein [Lolium perenne]|uniref:uncharacterized protein n=1 Tax=Lolium perenne TaxID=4522 RepID=UPI0021EA9DAC|nr:pathogen-associated molecular patterns-induced protein A70-like [Lolium perenne]
MDRAADATAAALGAWASVRGFFTPATLFIVVNLVIGTIALSSRFQHRRRRGNDDGQHHHQQHQQQPFHHDQEDRYYDDQRQHHQQQQQYVPPPPAPEPLARTSSVLDRLRSIGLYRFRSGDFPPEYAAGTDSMAAPAPDSGDAHHARSRSEPAPAPAREVKRRPKKPSRSDTRFNPEVVAPPPAPAARLVQPAVLEEDDHDDVEHEEEEYARADEFTDSNFTTPPEEEESLYREEYVPPLRPAPLPRAPSVLERLRSFGMPGFLSTDHAAGHAVEDVHTDNNYFTTHNHQHQQPPAQEPEEEEEHLYREEYVPPLRPAPLPRAPSVLERLRSFGMPGFLSTDHAADHAVEDVYTHNNNFSTHHHQQQQPPAQPEEEEQYYREEYVPPPRPAPLPRAPSVLERLRSFGLSRFRSGEVDAAAAVAELEQSHHATQYSRSRSEPSREQSARGKKLQQESAEARMSKSGSVARKPAPVEPEAEAGGVDARADDFINSFRKQLQLQRLNSLLNYKDMLNRGA